MDFGTELDEQNNTKHVDSFILAMSRTVGCKLKRDSFSCDITLIDTRHNSNCFTYDIRRLVC